MHDAPRELWLRGWCSFSFGHSGMPAPTSVGASNARLLVASSQVGGFSRIAIVTVLSVNLAVHVTCTRLASLETIAIPSPAEDGLLDPPS